MEQEGNNMKETFCVVCGLKIHKDNETKEMEVIYKEVWKDDNGEIGLIFPEHWHTTKGIAI